MLKPALSTTEPQIDYTLTVKFSAVVVCYNEAHLLRQCLQSIDFCSELIIVDMGSIDDSLAIAEEFGAKILYHELVPYPNLARQYGIAQAKYQWVVSIDPDEVFPKDEIEKIEAIILARRDLAGIRIPWQFYFKGKELHHTIFGRSHATKCVIVHRDRIKATGFVHKEFSQDQNIYIFSKPFIKPLKHYWMNSYTQLFEKMQRYIKSEGESKYAEGKRFSWLALLKYSAAALKKNLIDLHGLYGGFTGLFLSLFDTWYVFMSWLSLRQYEQRLKSSKHQKITAQQ